MQRFLERHAQLVLWTITIGLLLALLVVAARQGLLGEAVKDRILLIENALGTFVSVNERFFDYSSRVLGAIATLATAIIGIVKGIHYSEKKLPDRLADFVTRSIDKVDNHAEYLIAHIANPTAAVHAGTPLFHVGPLNRALDAIGSPRATSARGTFDQAHDEIERNIKLAETHLTELKRLQGCSHVIRGAAATARSSYEAHDGKDPNTGHEAAEADFTGAIAIPSTKLHGLELRGLLRTRRNNLLGALADFEVMEGAAKTPIDIARAQRLQSEVLIRLANGTNAAKHRAARRKLNAAANSLKTEQTPPRAERMEFARNRLAYGRLQRAMGNDSVATQSLQQALSAIANEQGHDAVPLRAEIDNNLQPKILP